MANGTVVTRKGLQLITKLVASETALTFTRVAIGTGKVPGGYDPGSMTGLNEYKMDGSIASHSASGDEASVVMQISSIGVETGFTITEAGLFATDPDEGEILYAYLDLSADPQYMYPENNAISKFIEMTLVVKIGEVQSVTAVINPGSLVTKEKFDEIAYPTLPKLDESKNEQDYILDGGEDIRWLLARYEYVKQHYAKSIDLMDEKRTSVHQNDIINGFGEGVTGDLVTVMGTILGQKHDTDINYLKNYGLLKSMITQANVDSLDKIPSAYLLYQLNKDLLDKYEDLLKKYNELNSNFAYRKGDSLTIDNVVIFGCITLQKAHLIFHIPLNKPCFASSCKISGNFYVRQKGAFLPETPWTQPLSINVYSLGITLKGGMIVVDMTGHIWDTATNNEGCVVHLFDTTITFT